VKYFAIEVPDDLAVDFRNVTEDVFPEVRIKQVVIDDIDDDTFETVEVLT